VRGGFVSENVTSMTFVMDGGFIHEPDSIRAHHTVTTVSMLTSSVALPNTPQEAQPHRGV
jgi:hypothetical protein